MAVSSGSCRTQSARCASPSFRIGRSCASSIFVPTNPCRRKAPGFRFLEMQYNTFMVNKPLVGILMGSDSDLSVMKEAAEALEQFGVGSEVHTLSAHRTPDAVVEYVQKSEAGGYKVFICGAGGAAHLAGVVAAHTALPVIGVPLRAEKMGAAGVDALFSTVQMPPGIPVATVGIG